jgi:hypothetical protein
MNLLYSNKLRNELRSLVDLADPFMTEAKIIVKLDELNTGSKSSHLDILHLRNTLEESYNMNKK